MELSYILAQGIGVTLVFIGAASLLKYKAYQYMVRKMAKRRATVFFASLAEFLIGLSLVLVHNIWDGPFWQVLITIFAWMALIEGGLYILLPHRVTRMLLDTFNTKNWYIVGGILAIVIGFYLAMTGFQIF